ncbi:unnamed protein product, partial [Iphiclides podalirius]
MCSNIKCFVADTLDTLVESHRAVAVIAAVVLLSIIIPLVTKAVHNKSETKVLKNILSTMTSPTSSVCFRHERLSKTEIKAENKKNFFQRIFRPKQPATGVIKKSSEQ